jgi:beta-lactam-binding protein with PASTA domain/tRNA A-37 threonylcarbamoyl transferase component Bud32
VTERLDAETVVDGRYRVLHRVGSGGMAEVYCAQDLQLGRKVALKILYRRFAEDGEFVERFRREASSAAGLQHQHVVSVYDRGEYDGTYYIAMEYLDGRSLKRIIQEEAPLHPDRAIDLTIQVLRAARFAHRRGIIHRDFKPHNVIVDAEGRAKVTDFGIARAGASDMTQTGSIMGTAQYLSPEQAQGVSVSAASDLYSIGIVLYEMLTGRVPFEGESAVSIALKQVNERPVPPSAYNPAVTPQLEAVVLRALEKDPMARFRDADEFIGALQAAREGTGPIPVAPLGPPTMVEPPLEAYPYPPEPLAPRPERDGSRWWLWLLALLVVAGIAVAGVLLLGTKTKKVPVPAVVGRTQAVAQARLTAAGFDVKATPHVSQRTKGLVIAQDPAGGAKAGKGSTVTLTVSSGPAQVPVPEVTGLTRKSAAARLANAGLTEKDRFASSDTVAKGRVVSASPKDGTPVAKGSSVTLTVSSGKQQVAVPALTGKKFTDAQAQLQAAGLTAARTDQETTDQPAGTVLSQAPAAGTQVDKGSSVALIVAKEPAKVDIPDVTGEDQATATAKLEAAGFVVTPRTKSIPTPDGDGTVIEESPSGRKVHKGATITITIGTFTQPPAGTGTTTTPGATG